MEDMNDYHGIVVNISQKSPSIWPELDVIGKKSVIRGMLVLYKIRVSQDELASIISKLQDNLRNKLFYAHLYRSNELIVVFKNRIMKASPDPSCWSDIISYGRSLHIPSFWLDFEPCRFEDEQF